MNEVSAQLATGLVFCTAAVAWSQTDLSATGADNNDATSSGWRLSLTPYLWVPAQDGDIAIQGNPAAVDLSVGDSLDAIKDNFNAALTLRGEIKKDRLAFFGDIMYLDLEADGLGASGADTVSQEQGVFEAGAAYDLIRKPLGDGGSMLTIAPLAGLRAHALSLDLDPAASTEVTGDQNWVDVFAGLRGRLQFSSRLALFARADVGAGGSDSTYNILGGIEFGAWEKCSILAGYRLLDVDYSDGEGANLFTYDMQLHGPFIAMMFRF